MITTNNRRLAARLREFRNNGMRCSRAGWKSHYLPGLNYRMTDIQAALGVSQARRLPEILAKKLQIASWYDERLSRCIPEIDVPRLANCAGWNRTFYVVKLPRRYSARRIASSMLRAGVETQTFVPVHLEPVFRKIAGQRLPVTEAVAKSLLALPSHLAMTEDSVELVIHTLRVAMDRRNDRSL